MSRILGAMAVAMAARCTALVLLTTSTLFKVANASAMAPDRTAVSLPGGQGIGLGVYRPEFWQPGSPAAQEMMHRLQSLLGGNLGIVHWFVGWGTNGDFDLAGLEAVKRQGAIPMITWEPGAGQPNDPAWTLKDAVLSGKNDAYIDAWARGMAAYGAPVILRFAHEMNATSYPWGVGVNGNTAADYVAAWRHVHGIFSRYSTSNVKWLWTPNTMGDTHASVYEPLYRSVFPGDDVVDLVGADVYNTGPSLDWGAPRWRTFSEVLSEPYKAITAISTRPFIISEIGSAQVGGSKPAWIADALQPSTLARFPALRAIVWFDMNKEAQWSLDAGPDARQAWLSAGSQPMFAAGNAWLHG